MCQIKVDRQIATKIAAKITRFNSVNSKIIARKVINFVHDVAELLPFYFLKAASRSLNSLWNATVKSKGRSWRRLQSSPKFNWLP